MSNVYVKNSFAHEGEMHDEKGQVILMARTRRNTAVKSMSARKTRTATPKPAKPTYTANRIRAAFPNLQKEIIVKITEKDLKGTVNVVNQKLAWKAQAAGIKGEFEIAKKVGRSKGYYNSPPYWAIVGYRPYTDAELVSESDKLIKKANAQIERDYKKRLKEVQDFNKRAARLGQPLMEEPGKPTPVTL